MHLITTQQNNNEQENTLLGTYYRQKDYKSPSKVFKQNFVNQGPLNEVFENK